MSIKALKWSKFVAYVSASGLSAVFLFIALLVEKPVNTHDVVLAAGVALTSLAGAVGSLIPSPATSVVENATTVTPGGTPTGATVNSSHPE